ncbi:MAG: PQQ-binding-like beta-propeller repeat protein [Verrucomicrobia bacterium]|nr:PQQ-binding-like beta-propeller repeat protein [Verrucomicrobiota bacterium]
MTRYWLLVWIGVGIFIPQTSADFPGERIDNWHQWRGPNGNGVAPHGKPPIRWSEDSNVRWKVGLPGEGTSTPIIWGNQIFLVAAIETDRDAPARGKVDPEALTEPPTQFFQFLVLSVDRNTGKELWRRIATEAVPHQGRHPTHSYAAASPVTDGNYLYVSFGSRGIFCFDLAGKLIWTRALGQMRTRYGWGEATSPVLSGDALIVNWDHEDQSFILALDVKTGETRWKADRDEPTSWSTPLAVEQEGQTQIIVNGTNRIRSYDLSSGAVLWECGGLTLNCIPSPVRTDQAVICMSGYRGAAVFAIPFDSKGDLTGTQKLAWSYHRATPYVPSPLLYRNRLYFTYANSAVLTCLDAQDGTPVFEQQRLPELGTLYASPTAAGGYIFIVDRDGLAVVLQDGPSIEIVATNRLNAQIDASPAIVGTQLFLRGRRELYCIQSD